MKKETEKEARVEIPIIFHHGPDGPTRDYRMEKMHQILDDFGQKINKRSPVRAVEVTIEKPKNSVGKVVAYNVKLYVVLKSGKSYMASSGSFVEKSRHVGLESNLRLAAKEIQKQIDR